jgi:hypothetical protein
MANMSNAPAATAAGAPTFWQVARETIRFILKEFKPKGKMLTPFNVITGAIILVGLVLIAIRFAYGLSSVTNLSQNYPWGIWIGFDVVTGVAFAGGAYVLTFLVHILKVKKYEPIVRVTVLNGFLAYVFYAGALLLDLGRPWNVINPIIGNSFGLSSVLFLVAWHFLLYMICEFLEFSPAVAEWLHCPADPGGLDDRRRHLRDHPVDAASVGPGRALPPGPVEDPPLVVFAQYSGDVLHLEHLRGNLHGHDREHVHAQGLQGPDRA